MTDKQIERLCTLIGTTEWHIDFSFGLQYLSNYFHEIELHESGIKIKDFAEQREKNVLHILQESNSYKSSVSRRETIIQPHSIGVIELNGTMRLNDGLSSKGTKSIEKEINLAKSDPNIDGLILEIASGGGESLAGNHLYTVLKSFGKPIVSAVHYAGSAAYKAAVGTNEIIGIGEGSMFGSIGSFVSIDKGMIEYFKNNVIDIYSDLSPQKNKEFRELLESGKFDSFKKELNESVKSFHSIVVSERELENDELTKDTLEGGMFRAKEAKKRGLVDQVGSFDIAVNRLKSHINLYKKNRI